MICRLFLYNVSFFFFLLNVRHFTRTLLEKLMRSLQINGMKSVQMCALETKRIRLWRAAMPSSALYRRLKEFYEGDVGFVNTAGVIYYKDWCGIKVPVSDQYNWQNEILAVCSSNIFLKKKKSAHHVCFKRVSFFFFFFKPCGFCCETCIRVLVQTSVRKH